MTLSGAIIATACVGSVYALRRRMRGRGEGRGRSLATLEPLPDVAALSPLVLRILGGNPGLYTLQENLPRLLSAMEGAGVRRVSDVLISHYHRDHTEGLIELRRHFGPSLRAWKVDPPYAGAHGPSASPVFAELRPLQGGQDGSASLRVLCTPGHTPDHACFELCEEGSVFTGDCVLGGSSAVFEDLHDYMTSLKSVLAVARGRLYPGHGPVIEDGAEGIRSYIGHREARGGEGRGSAEAGEEAREAQIVAALEQTSWCGLSPLGLVRRVYPRLPWTLRLAAAHNVAQHLDALQRQGRVARRAWLPLPRGYFRLIAMLASWW
ncbi:putative B-lactamase, partial [Emiliania huxleyi CCMP1516]|uniref:Metallo-beta-lactamase domain-containing protein n=2 Tax=Emiliania huxleyi TaxID=2903 RepID=A0A0D3I7E7_EMIH1